MSNSEPTVAIVDDDEADGNAIQGLLRSIGLVAHVFYHHRERSSLRSPELSQTDCLVVDFNMPKMSGLDLHNSLSLMGKEIPTVLITAHAGDDIRARALQAGVICCLPKPFDQTDLLRCIQIALDRSASACSSESARSWPSQSTSCPPPQCVRRIPRSRLH